MLDSTGRRSLLMVTLMVSMGLFLLTSEFIATDVEAASGIDVTPTDFDITYTSSSDETKYRLLSSHDPSGSGFNRPVDLFVIDGMLNKSSKIEVTLQNLGTTASGAFTISLVVLHNEYTGFEILNTTLNVGSIGAGGTATTSTNWIPRYGGNHTMIATTQIANDDNKLNDGLTRSLAIGQIYDNCDTQGSWNLASGWSVDSTVSLSNSAFNIGSGGTSSTYGASWDRSLTSPVFDFSNAHSAPNTNAKVGFFYTGSAGSGDGIRFEWYDANSGNWVNTVNNGYTFSGVVDADLTDGSNWWILNQENSPGGTQRPGVNIPTSVLNSQTQMRIRFISDATDNGAGYWFEDIVMIYEEKAWPEEFQVSLSKGVDGHARRGHWADQIVTIHNDGNLTDFYQPSVTGLPTGWESQFVHLSGSTILPSMDIEVGPGETFSFKVQIKPGPSATTGSHSSTTHVTSTQQGGTSASIAINTLVDPEYIPDWVSPPSSLYCLPGSSCEFSVNLSNIGDGSDTFAVAATQVIQWANWTFDVSFNQPPTVTIAPGSSSPVLLQADIPLSALPGQTASIDLVATSQADNTVTATIRVNLTASMVTDASTAVSQSDVPPNGWWVEPSESVLIPFTVWNNASSQDTFTFALDPNNMRGWNATLPATTTLVIRSQESAKIVVTLTAPPTAQSGDPAPLLTPIVLSTTSGTTADSTPYGGVRVTMLHDLTIRPLGTPTDVIPGENSVFSFEVENFGNGDELALLSTSGIPSTWNYHFEVGATEVTGPVSLSPAYDGNHIIQVQLIFAPPGGEEANLELDITAIVQPADGGDINASDNSHEFTVRTQRVTTPVLVMNTSTLDVKTDSLHVLELSVLNDGNAVDGAMKVRITADTIIPGITSSLTSGSSIVYLNEWLDTPIPPQTPLGLDWLIEIDSDVLVGTRIIFTVSLEASPDDLGNQRIVNKTLVLTVTSHRELVYSHSLSIPQVVEPGERLLFEINVTSYSSFTEELVLRVGEGEAWKVICINEPAEDYRWQVVLPSTNDPDGRGHVWDCEATVPDTPNVNSMDFNVYSSDEKIWYATTDLLIEEAEIEEGGFFLGLGDANKQMPILIGSVALLFLIFVSGMVIAINRKKRSIIDEFDDDDEQPYASQNQGSHAATSVGQTNTNPTQQFAGQSYPQNVAPTPQFTPPIGQPIVHAQQEHQHSTATGFTDDQYRAAGWSEEKIANLRMDEAKETATEQSAILAAQQQQQYTMNSHQVVGSVMTPHHQPPTQPQQAVEPVAQPPQTGDLSTAFGSLGVTTEANPESLPDTNAALSLLGGGNEPEPTSGGLSETLPDTNAALSLLGGGNEPEPTKVESSEIPLTDNSQSPLGQITELQNTEETANPNGVAATETNLPKVNCGFCQGHLTVSDQWHECLDCGIFSHSQCRTESTTCQRCGSSN